MLPVIRTALEAGGIKNPAAEVLPFCLLSNSRIKGIIKAIRESENVPGPTAEIGCAAGGTSLMIATLGGRKHWAIDTFEGLVDPGAVDTDLWVGQFSAKSLTVEAVTKRLAHLPNVSVVKGFFPTCAPSEMFYVRYSMVHIDVDTYASMRTCIDFFMARMNPGGLIVMDDVIGCGTVGGKKAWEETDMTGYSILESNDPQVIIRRDY